MNSPIARRPVPSSASLGVLFHDSAALVWKLLNTLEGFFARREQVLRDRQVLAEMTDRELADIGLYRGNLDRTSVHDEPWR